MNHGKSYSAPERLIYEVQGVIVDLKKEYFSKNQPLNDDETLVHKLCVRLENVLRYGAREKYTFMGSRKDYWNYINDSIPKDETVKFIQSISDEKGTSHDVDVKNQLKTYQGKGRAFLRQALMEKSLADTLQRCSINERITKKKELHKTLASKIREYYLTDSIFRNPQLLPNLVHSLYDLNAVDFQLPHKGYDLDRSFPSFARKSFGERRSTSTISQQDLPADPVEILNKNINNIITVVSSWNGSQKTQSSETTEELSLQKVIDKVAVLNEDINEIKTKTSDKIESLTLDKQKLSDENKKIMAESDLRVKQLNERFSSLQKLDTTATSDKFKELYDKLVATELKLTETETKYKNIEQEYISLKEQVKENAEEYETLKTEKEEVSNVLSELRSEMSQQKHQEQVHDSTNKILENKLSDLQKLNNTLKTQQIELNESLLEKESIIKTKDTELKSLQDAFEKSTGLVVGSFKELKDELHNQIQEKHVSLQTVTSANENLSYEAKSLQDDNEKLIERIRDLEKRCNDVSLMKDNAEKVVEEFRMKLTEEKNVQSTYVQFVNDLSKIIETSEDDSTEGVDAVDSGLDNEDGLLKKKKKIKLNRVEHADLPKVSPSDEREAALKRVLEMQQEILDSKALRKELEKEITGLKYELNSTTNSLKELQGRCTEDKQEKNSSEKKFQEQEKEVSRLNVEIDKYNGEIFTMSLELSQLNEKAVVKEEESKRAQEELVELKSTLTKLSDEKTQIENKKAIFAEELSTLKNTVEELNKKIVENETEISTLTSQLESQEASKTSTENELNFSKKELENTVVIKNEEIQSLKFQLSTEEMKKETAQKALSDLKKSHEELTTQLLEREDKLKNIELEQADHKTTLEVENENLADENHQLHKQLTEFKEKHTIAAKEIQFLKVQVSKLAKEKEEEKATRINGWNRLNNLIEEKKQMEEKYKEEIQQLTVDIDEMKSHLVNLTKDKHELWTKKDQMEFELKQRADERWVDDSEVKTCTNCQEIFSLTVRKHHCRLCGQIFCHKCSNIWLKTAQSKKKVRSCFVCAETYKETHGASDVVDGGSENNSLVSSDQMDITEESFDEYRQNCASTVSENTTLHPDGNATTTEDLNEEEDNFEFLDPAQVTSSGSFGESEQISVRANDLKLASVLPTVNEENSTLVVKEDVQLQVPAGLRTLLPVLVGNHKFELIWEFSSTPKEKGTSQDVDVKNQDVGFGIAFKENEDADDDSIQTSVPLSRYISHKQTIHGRMKIEKPGVYYLIFNNSYSRMTSKNVQCSVGLVSGKDVIDTHA